MTKSKPRIRFEVEKVPLTAEQRAATEKMLVTPCPYCSDPKKFQRELTGKGREDHTSGIARIGKFWVERDPDTLLLLKAYDHGDHFRIPISGKHFIRRFNDFHLDIINFEGPYSPWAFASYSLLFMLEASPGDIARHNKFPFNIARLSHKKSPIVVDAHTWFSHGSILTIHHLPRELSSDDVSVMQEALEFFRPETRGAPKVKREELVNAVKKFGPDATQAQVADELGITTRSLQRYISISEFEGWGEAKRYFLGL